MSEEERQLFNIARRLQELADEFERNFFDKAIHCGFR